MAERLVIVREREQLFNAVHEARAVGAPWWVFGGLSNVLLPDDALRGTVIINRIRRIVFDEAALQVRVASGTPMVMLAKAAIQRGWDGLTWAAGLPGSVGGAVVNNAGAFGGEVAATLVSAEIWDVAEDTVTEVPASWFEFDYRHSRLKGAFNHHLVVSATFQFKPAPPDELKQRSETILHKRMITQPGGRSLGSVFVNPPGDHAGRLIEAAGLKGVSRGGIAVSEQHANFFINRRRGTAEDYLALLRLVQQTVADKFGVLLFPEIEVIRG